MATISTLLIGFHCIILEHKMSKNMPVGSTEHFKRIGSIGYNGALLWRLKEKHSDWLDAIMPFTWTNQKAF